MTEDERIARVEGLLGNASAWDSSIDRLMQIRGLGDDWDGEGAGAPDPALVGSAIALARAFRSRGFTPADRVIAGTNGTVYFEWYTPLGYREIEVMSPDDAECRWVEGGSDLAAVVGPVDMRTGRCPCP